VKCFDIDKFYAEELLATRPTPKLEDYPLSAVRDCLFNIFAATLHIWKSFLLPQHKDAPCRSDRYPFITENVTRKQKCMFTDQLRNLKLEIHSLLLLLLLLLLLSLQPPVRFCLLHYFIQRFSVFDKIQSGSNMTGTNYDLFTQKSSRSYLNHLVCPVFHF
jgi:hypothetical protein